MAVSQTPVLMAQRARTQVMVTNAAVQQDLLAHNAKSTSMNVPVRRARIMGTVLIRPMATNATVSLPLREQTAKQVPFYDFRNRRQYKGNNSI